MLSMESLVELKVEVTWKFVVFAGQQLQIVSGVAVVWQAEKGQQEKSANVHLHVCSSTSSEQSVNT